MKKLSSFVPPKPGESKKKKELLEQRKKRLLQTIDEVVTGKISKDDGKKKLRGEG